MHCHVSKSPDPKGLEAKIRPLVMTLNGLDLATFSSCEGHVSPCAPRWPHPMVAISLNQVNSNALMRLMENVCRYNDARFGPSHVRWTLTPAFVGDQPLLILQPNLDPARSLEEKQASAQVLAEYLESIELALLQNR